MSNLPSLPSAWEVYQAIERFAPVKLAVQGDKVGFLAGRRERPVRRVMAALDITASVIEEARLWGAQMIVSHHPLYFSLSSITDESVEGRNVISLIESDMAAVCMHTNLDSVQGGVNDTLCDLLGVGGERICFSEKGITPRDDLGMPYGLARAGVLNAPRPVAQFAADIKKTLSCSGVRYQDSGRPAHRVAVCSGSGGSLLEEAAFFGCDTFVTADIKYSVFLQARQLGISLIDAGHFRTENVICPVLVGIIREAFPALEVKIAESLTEDAVFI